MENQTIYSVSVTAPARLHLGFLDLHGGLGRIFGSIGVCLENIATRMTLTPSHTISAEGPSSERAARMAAILYETLSLDGGVHIEIDEAIDEHIGLGSGTQLSLAVGMGVKSLNQLETPIKHIARLLGRGDRSGIGIGTFQHGGFLVDGGRSSDTDVPPIISHLDFPEGWRFILVFDRALSGVHGDTERQAFKLAEPMIQRDSELLCRHLLMQVLPAIAEQDCKTFGQGISKIQETIGDYFAEWQGGRYCSPAVSEVISWFHQHGACGAGQSSWGPTGFAVYPNETEAYQALKKVRQHWSDSDNLDFMICKARNEKAHIKITNELNEQRKNQQESITDGKK